MAGLGDISINGNRYRIDVATWREKDIIDFAPRATVPTGSVVMSDLNLFQPLVQTDWRHGFGFHWYDDAAGYMKTDGNIDTRQDGMAMLMTKATSSDTDNNRKDGMVSFGGNIYTYGVGGVRKFDGTSWSQLNTRYVSVGTAYGDKASSSSSCTVSSVSVKTAANRLLLVTVHLKTNVAVSDVTWRGTSLGAVFSTVGTAPKTRIYKLVAPSTGTGSVVVTLGAAADVIVNVLVLYGVDQTTPLGTDSTKSTTGVTSSTITYSSAANRIVFDAITIDSDATLGVNSGDTSDKVQNIASSLSGGIGHASGAASVNVGFTWTGATDGEHIAVEVNFLSAEPTCNFLLNAGDYMFICPNGGRIQKMTTAGVISDAGLDHSSADYKWLIIHEGYIYAGKDARNYVFYDTNEDLSQLEGTTSDPNIIYCGIGNIRTIEAIVYAGQLYVSRQDGLWHIGSDHIARRVLDYSGNISDDNFRSMAILNGYLVFPIKDRLIQWNGARVSDITPNRITDVFPFITYGFFDNLVEAGNFLYVSARTNETTYDLDLLCYDGIGWHKLMSISADTTTDTCSMIGFDGVNNRIWYHLNTTSDITYYVPLQDYSSFPYADFPTTGTNSLITSRLDMGFRRIKKSMASLLVEARNCSATQYISVYYQIEGDGTWVHWSDIKTNGVIELTNPAGFVTREFTFINLRFDLVTGTATSSPILESWTMRFIMRPDTLLGFNFWIVAYSNYISGIAEDERTAAEIRNELLTIRNSKAPVELVGLEGDTHYGYLTSFQGQPIYRKTSGSDDQQTNPNEIEWRFQINFVEVMQV